MTLNPMLDRLIRSVWTGIPDDYSFVLTCTSASVDEQQHVVTCMNECASDIPVVLHRHTFIDQNSKPLMGGANFIYLGRCPCCGVVNIEQAIPMPVLPPM